MILNNDYEHDLSIDKHDGNNKCFEYIKLEIDQQQNYDTFKDIGKKPPPKGRKNIRTHFVFDVKYDGRNEAMLVADGSLTDVPLYRVCSGFVSLRRNSMVLFLA